MIRFLRLMLIPERDWTGLAASVDKTLDNLLTLKRRLELDASAAKAIVEAFDRAKKGI